MDNAQQPRTTTAEALTQALRTVLQKHEALFGRMATVKTEAGYFAIHIRETLAPEIFAVVAAATAAATMAQTQAEPVAQGLTDAAVLDWLELADSVTIGRNRADETTEVVAIFGDQPIISEHESLRAAVRAALSTGEHK